MSQATDTLGLIQNSFPGRERSVERAFRDSPSFRDLCEDYRKCVGALHLWQQAAAREAPPRWQEYSELLLELGSEIQSWLEAVEDGPDRQDESNHRNEDETEHEPASDEGPR